MYFNLPKSRIYKAVTFKKLLSIPLIKFFRILFLSVGIICAVAYSFTVNQQFLSTVLKSFIPFETHPVTTSLNNLERYTEYSQKSLTQYNEYIKTYSAIYNFPALAPFLYPSMWLGLSLLLTPLGLSLLFVQIFFEFHLKSPRRPTEGRASENLAEFLDYDAAFVFNNAVTISNMLKEKELSTNSLFFALVDYKPSQIVFMRLGVNPSHLKNLLASSIGLNWKILSAFLLFRRNKQLSADTTKLLIDANKTRVEEKRDRIAMIDLLTSLFDLNAIFKQLVIQHDLGKEDLNILSRWHEDNETSFQNSKRFWRLANLIKSPPIGIEWTYGYPHALSSFTRDVSIPLKKTGKEIPLIDREKELEKIEQVLSQGNNANVMLVGEEGVGKRSIVVKLAEKIYAGKAGPNLNYKKILELDLTLAASSSGQETDVVNTLNSIFSEAAEVGNIIVLIQDIQNFVGGGDKAIGSADISAILTPYIQSSRIQMIATTDPISFHKHIATNSAILSSFTKVDIGEIGKKDAFQIIADTALAVESSSDLFFTYGAMKTITEDSDRFLHNATFPEKGVSLLHEVAGYVQSQRKSVVMAQDVHEVITKKTNIPLGTITTKEREELMQLDAEMHKEIVGQEKAVSAVVQTLQRLRSGIAKEGKPAGVFLFVGPTGVGKTLTAKILAKHYFGSETRMIRLDMSEYQTKDSIGSLIGSVRSNEPGRLVSIVQDNPFSVLLLDEVEKAHKDILNLFLQVFDEGWITDAFGRKVSFEQNIIIATSNAGATYIREMINQGIDPALQKEKIMDILIGEGYFKPELLNRFDEIVIFHPLGKDHIKKIAEILMANLVKRLEQKGYYFLPTNEIVSYIADVGFDPQFGARPMNRAIQDKIETAIARKILEGTIQKAQEFTLRLDEID